MVPILDFFLNSIWIWVIQVRFLDLSSLNECLLYVLQIGPVQFGVRKILSQPLKHYLHFLDELLLISELPIEEQ